MVLVYMIPPLLVGIVAVALALAGVAPWLVVVSFIAFGVAFGVGLMLTLIVIGAMQRW